MSVMTSGTRPRMKAIRRGREGVRDGERPGPSENQASREGAFTFSIKVLWRVTYSIQTFIKYVLPAKVRAMKPPEH